MWTPIKWVMGLACGLVLLMGHAWATADTPQGVLTVEALKRYQSSTVYSTIEMRVTNRSAIALRWCLIDVEVSDRHGRYLGLGHGIVRDLGPGDARVVEVLVRAADDAMQTWTVTLQTVRGYGSMQNLAPQFQLELIEPQRRMPSPKVKSKRK
jgi:hypothetical protein